GEISLRRLLFAKLFLCACAAKEKADYRLSVCFILLNMNFVINLTLFEKKGFPYNPSQKLLIFGVLTAVRWTLYAP
ncbi:MAG: hypothetical protein ACI3X1_06320, partial [Eubacteriales bacterium]